MAAACTVTNRAKYLLLHQSPALDFDTSRFQIGLLGAALTSAQPAAVRDFNVVNDLLSVCAEASGGGYARKDSNTPNFTLTVSEDDANDLAIVTIDADQVWTIATGQTIYGAFITIYVDGTNANDLLLQVIEFTSGIPTNGGTLTLQFPTDSGHARSVLKVS